MTFLSFIMLLKEYIHMVQSYEGPCLWWIITIIINKIKSQKMVQIFYMSGILFGIFRSGMEKQTLIVKGQKSFFLTKSSFCKFFWDFLRIKKNSVFFLLNFLKRRNQRKMVEIDKSLSAEYSLCWSWGIHL